MLTDEAHRTQYGGLAANMRQALPNAAFFGFTGTPIDKKDRSTLSTFGSYIDTYTIEQAVADGATVPIFYESRLPELRIVGNTLDALFDRVFADRSEEEREAIKKKYANEATIAGAPKRVEAICLDLVTHFTQFIRPNGFKAQVVTCSREIAALYKETLDRLNAPQSAIVISGSNKDDDALVKHHTEREAAQGHHRAIPEARRSAVDPCGVRHAADRVRCAGRAGHVPGLAAEGAHPAASHRAGEPHGRQEDLRLDRGLLGRVRGAARGAGHLRAQRHQGRHAPQGRRAAAPASPARRRHALSSCG